MYSAYLDVPFVPTPSSAFPFIFEALDIRSGDVLYELGSGSGRFLRKAARLYPDTRFVGVERNPFLYYYAILLTWLAGAKNVTYQRKNFFDLDLSPASKLYVYLTTPVMKSIYDKCVHELHGARLVSRAFQFEKKESSSVVEISKRPGLHGQHRLYVYDF